MGGLQDGAWSPGRPHHDAMVGISLPAHPYLLEKGGRLNAELLIDDAYARKPP